MLADNYSYNYQGCSELVARWLKMKPWNYIPCGLARNHRTERLSVHCKQEITLDNEIYHINMRNIRLLSMTFGTPPGKK